jgi:hypothetical protein
LPNCSNAQSPTQTRDPNAIAKTVAESNDNKFKVETINIGDLRTDKCFVKLTKRLQKELDELKRRQVKQREAVQKQQVSECHVRICRST